MDEDGDVTQLLMSGQKIAAIKLVRTRRNLGLKEAKDYVDAIEAGIDPALRAQIRGTSNNFLTWWFYATILAALIYAAMRWRG
jgi:hypothetical protein